jgi:putative toxin-antitoxin system antitoxin component (TIGR02293 family)
VRQSSKRLSPRQWRRLLNQARRRQFDLTKAAHIPALKRIRRLWHVALETFKSAAKAERFLLAPHPALYMRSPIELASKSDAALEEIVELLARLALGSAP